MLLPCSIQLELRTLIQGMLESGMVCESSNPWAAPVVLVKKTGSWRLCVDYRKMNAVTHEDRKDPHQKAEWYSTLELASGYWQVEIDQQDPHSHGPLWI